MKKILYSALAASVFLLGFTACAKDTKQVKRSWIVTSVIIDGADSSAEWTKNQYLETYGDNDVYSFSGDPNGKKGEGDYQWTNGSKIKRSGVSNQASVEIDVIKVTRKEFQYKFTKGGKLYEFKFDKY
jgi:hypothetical protein